MAAKRKIGTTRVGPCEVNVYRDSEWGEYVVKTVVRGRPIGTGYHTTDKGDARDTAAAQARWLARHPDCGPYR